MDLWAMGQVHKEVMSLELAELMKMGKMVGARWLLIKHLSNTLKGHWSTGRGFSMLDPLRSCWWKIMIVHVILSVLGFAIAIMKYSPTYSPIVGDLNIIEAANGLQAWKILENLSNHID